MSKGFSRCNYRGDFPAKPSRLNFSKNFSENSDNDDGSFNLYFGTGNIKSTLIPTQNTLTFQILFMTFFFVTLFLTSFTTASPTRQVRSFTGDDLSADLVLKRHSTPMTVKVAFLRPHNYSTALVNGGEYSASPTTRSQNVTTLPQQAVANNNNNNNHHTSKIDDSSALPPVITLSVTNESTMVPPPETTRSKNVNLAVIPVLGIFFLMVLVCVKGCSWFREHLKEHDIEDDGKDYVILSPPEDGYREVEFRSDTSSMYYDTVSSYRSILRQKGDFYGYNNYDTVTSIRSILQRADVRDAAVQVRLQSRRPDRWKSVSGILNNGGGGGSNSDLLRVPRKTHRQVSFQTSHNESYPPPSPRTCDVNIQVGVSTMERWKQQQGKSSTFQNGIAARQISPGHGSRNCLISALPSRHSSASLRSMDRVTEGHPLTRTDSTGGASTNSNSAVTNAWPGAVARPKNRRFHHFQVLRVNSTDRLGSRMDVSPLRPVEITPHYISQNQSISSLDNVDSSGGHQNRFGRPERSSSTLIDDRHGELYGAPMTTMCHPHYLCDQFVQTDSDSANDAMSPATAAAHTSFSPPILTKVELNRPRSEDEDLDALDEERKISVTDGRRHELYIGDSSDTTGEESLVTSGRNSASWSEQMDEEDELQKLLQAHASAIARAPIASPVSMDSTSSSCNTSTDDVAQRVELDSNHHSGTEAGDATTASEDSGEGRSAIDQSNSGQTENSEQRDEETPLIEQSFTDIGSSPYSQSPDIGSGTLTITRPHRVSSGYDTQGPESSSVKGPAEAGDSSCDVTPLTSSSNSLQEFGRDAGKMGLHSQLPLQLLMFQHLQLEERAHAQKTAELESRQQVPSSYPLKDTVTGLDSNVSTLTPTMDQPLSYIPQIPPPDSPNIPAPSFQTKNNKIELNITDKIKDNSESMDCVQIMSTASTPPTFTDCPSSNSARHSTSEMPESNDNNDSVSKLDATCCLTGSRDYSGHLQTPASNITDNFRVQAAQVDDPLRIRVKTETLPKVVNPLTTLPPPPPPPTKGASSAHQARKRANTTTDSNGKR